MKILKIVSKEICKICLFLCVIWFFLMFIYSLFYKISGLYKTNYIFKTKNEYIFIAEDNIMSPIVEKDDIVIIKKVENQLNEKDIVYIREGDMQKLARIEHIKQDNDGNIMYITKGIKNYYYNTQDVYKSNIIGKFKKRYKNLSLSFKIATSNLFTIIVSVIMVLLLYIMIKNEKRRKKRRNARLI